MNSADSACVVACALCVGAAYEPYLAATLASIASAVDVLVVNDNSGLERGPNTSTLEESPFAARLHVAANPFVDFARMRNDAHALLAALDPAPDWVLFIDADEVHGEQVRHLARTVVPALPRDVAQVDAYTFHFWGTFGWITDIARRMVFYRFSPTLRWVNPIHEKLQGLEGRALVVPYVYHHYGNVAPPGMLAAKHQRYYSLGNPVPEPPQPETANLEMFLARAGSVRPFRHAHPAAARPTIAHLERLAQEDFRRLDAAFRAKRTPTIRLATALQGALEALRVQARRLEHPGRFRAPTVAR